MFDDEEQNQDETTLLPARLRFAYRLMGLDPDSDRQPGGSPSRAMQRQGGTPEMRAIEGDQSRPRLQQEAQIPGKLSIGQRLMQRDATYAQRVNANPSGGIATGMAPPLPGIDGTRSSSVLQRKPQTPRKLSIGQRLMGLGAASGQRGNGRSGIAPKLTIGQRLMGLDGRGGFGVGNPRARQGASSGFIPPRAVPDSLELTGNRWLGDGRNAFTPSQQAAPIPRPTGTASIVDMTPQSKVRSLIPRPAAEPDVKPDLNLKLSNPKRPTSALGGLMRGIGGPETAPIGIAPNGRLVRDVTYGTKAPSRIPRVTPVPDVKANLKVRDLKPFRTTVGSLTRGIGGPETAPMGIAPSGSLMRDVSYGTKEPSRIPRQYERGAYFSNVNTDFIKGK